MSENDNQSVGEIVSKLVVAVDLDKTALERKLVDIGKRNFSALLTGLTHYSPLVGRHGMSYVMDALDKLLQHKGHEIGENIETILCFCKCDPLQVRQCLRLCVQIGKLPFGLMIQIADIALDPENKFLIRVQVDAMDAFLAGLVHLNAEQKSALSGAFLNKFEALTLDDQSFKSLRDKVIEELLL